MRKTGYAESTIETTGKRLRAMSRHVNLNDPEAVKGYIALKKRSDRWKQTLCHVYDRHVRFNGLSWDKPCYKRYDGLRIRYGNGWSEDI